MQRTERQGAAGCLDPSAESTVDAIHNKRSGPGLFERAFTLNLAEHGVRRFTLSNVNAERCVCSNRNGSAKRLDILDGGIARK